MNPMILRDIVMGELDRAIGCSRWWGKMETCDTLGELRQRIMYRMEKIERDSKEEKKEAK